MIAGDEIIFVMDVASTKMTDIIATSAVSIKFYDKKVRYKLDCSIVHTFLLAIMLLLIITIICYCYEKYRSKLKGSNALTI